jgi:polyribonucleotide nucleotidyltransferase
MDKVEFKLGEQTLSIETGRLAKQSNGSVLVGYGDAAVLVTVNTDKPREGIDFFPLTVDYVEKSYAAGRIPGGFLKREARLSDKEVLTSRFIDRALRPLFPDGYRDETQLTATVLSAQADSDTDILGFIGASAAISLSDIPFRGPIGAVRVVRVDGQLVVNPTFEQTDKADIHLIVAGKRDALVMVEGGARGASEEDVVAALRLAHDAIQPVLDAQEDLVRRVGKTKRQVTPPELDTELKRKIEELALERIREASQIVEKGERYQAVGQIKKDMLEKLLSEYRNQPREFRSLADVEEAQAAERKLSADIKETLSRLRADIVRKRILDGQPRIDGRSPTEVRPITCDVRSYPRVHGSGLFTRGETQAFVAVTLGGGKDEKMIEGLRETYYSNFYLNYNFPPFSVGEVRQLRGPGRREIGHGALAQRAIQAVMPADEECLYTVRIVSEILESNGSSSMATICGASLALMDAGIQIQAPVAGIAMGLISEGDRFVVLSDILGDEDHLGDMDFKVAGTRDGITRWTSRSMGSNGR